MRCIMCPSNNALVGIHVQLQYNVMRFLITREKEKNPIGETSSLRKGKQKINKK